MLQIITDSTADLSREIAERANVKVIPLSVIIGGKTYRDGRDIDQQKLFSLIKQTGELPKTAAPSIGEFHEMFDHSEETVFIGISSQLSATIQNALLAAQEFPAGKVRVIDSLNLSTGIGLLALAAADLRDQGMSAAQVESEIQRGLPKTRMSFMIDTMEYLYKGGRCSAMENIFGTMLKIHPIIEMQPDGKLGVKDKAYGSRKKSMQLLLDDFEKHLDELDPRRVFVTHTSPDEDAEYLKEEIIKLAAPQEVLITRAGSVVTSHCGPGTIGILYMVK
ncbi:MAG: fatty acid kinase fatty acid binding subunit [Chloroflexota bacterium]|nr:fatty acid kinase fatty acid binding subunit [Chloroflexota bacterium]